MKSQGHSTGSLVGKGNFCTKFSDTGTILAEIANTYYNRSEYKKRYRDPFKIRDLTSSIAQPPRQADDLKSDATR